MSMQIKQGKAGGPDPCTSESIGRLYRNVIIKAVNDLGGSNAKERNSAKRWLESDKFEYICHLSRWEEDFIVSLVESINALPTIVSKQIIKECVEMLRAIAPLDPPSDVEELPNKTYASSTPKIAASGGGYRKLAAMSWQRNGKPNGRRD